ncbi:DUF2268 domain-containing protein [Cytobacillus sp. IB215665]|uniref:DUF2268 domain-containing protein n=1 Tax=Cytobacillus sp. IB215665 TaxID=3097357 RepID=UPI002A0AC669|nr:DUF2268 domain-containing protein [Cytobacillus sp. IB215665]MDX8364452.1 DUF2268 domain-containing protein [Cytobacillus sp. IB215665]
MPVISTYEWLDQWYDEPNKLCKKLANLFGGSSERSIYSYLRSFGMYRPSRNGKECIHELKENKVWGIVKKEHQLLQKEWAGEDVPIFIFPADSSNPGLREYNGKSGVAFKDKLFLFVSPQNEKNEIRALFTHEYNHVCRLSKYKKNDDSYTLLDTIILEGLAENAVRERLGDKYAAAWTNYYTQDEAQYYWNKIIKPKMHVLRSHRIHDQLLYGHGLFPKMVGYNVGYQLVKSCIDHQGDAIKTLLSFQSNDIVKYSEF